MSAARKGGKGNGEEENHVDETQEYELEDVDDEEIEEEEVEDEDIDEQDLDDEELDDEDLEGEDYDEDEEVDQEDELDQVVSAETQEWDGLEAAEAEADEPTLVASARDRVHQAGSAITSGFEKVGGKKVTSGFKAVRRHIGFPLWLRFLTASFVIVAAVAGATSASLILYLSDIANALKNHAEIAGLDPFLSKTSSSGPQTILIIGSDKRNQAISGKFGLSDTTMLLRLDPDRGAIALLSLPRDLKVEIPGVGTDKLNAAYSLGGPKLTLRTVKSLTGLDINHLVNVDFTGFARAVNAIGCVYVDVDRRYYIAPNSGTSEINLQPGYQALCGFDALSFARYRHTDNDIVRAARQQAFLREARAKVPPSRLIEDRKKLVKIFTTYTSSDIGSAEEMLQVLRLFFDLRGAQIKEIHFNGTLGPSYVTATPDEIHTAVNQFLGVEGTPGPAGSSAKPKKAVAPQQPPDHSKSRPASKKKSSGSSLPSTLTPTSYGKQLAQAIRARKEKVPVYYPTVLEEGSDYAQKPRVYKINGKGDASPPKSERAAYKWVFSLPTLGDYYGFEGTRWKDPPILSDPTDEKTIGDRDYKLYYDGDRLRMVAWQTNEGSFWVSNSLIETVPNVDMLKIAQGFRQLPGT
jgi:LCP family protein required for cell wall assembly